MVKTRRILINFGNLGWESNFPLFDNLRREKRKIPRGKNVEIGDEASRVQFPSKYMDIIFQLQL